MKTALILVSTGCIVWLLNVLVTLRVSRGVYACLSSLALVGLLGYFVFPRIEQTEDTYAVCWGFAMVPVWLSAIFVATGWLADLRALEGVEAIVVSFLVGLFFTELFNSQTPQSTARDLLACSGFAFTALSIIALASAVPPCRPVDFWLRLDFGLFWLASGAYAFCLSLGIVRNRTLWTAISGHASQVLIIIFFGGAALLLSGMQRELATQEIRDMAVAHAEVGE